MPFAADTICNEPSCNKRTQGRYCDKHKRDNNREDSRKEFDRQRGSSASRGYGHMWRRLRQIILHRDPLCRIGHHCNFTAASRDVDHIIPRSQGGEDKEDNLQGACHECHSWKTATQDSKFAKKST